MKAEFNETKKWRNKQKMNIGLTKLKSYNLLTKLTGRVFFICRDRFNARSAAGTNYLRR